MKQSGPEMPKPESWIPSLNEARDSVVSSYATEGAGGVTARKTLEGRVNEVLAARCPAGIKFKPLPPQHVCQVVSLMATLQFRKHNDLILVEQQVSVFAKITPLKAKGEVEGSPKSPLFEVAFYQHVDPFVEYAITFVIASADPLFIKSAHPYTRPSAI